MAKKDMKWLPYEPGDVIHNANVQVLEVIAVHNTQEFTKYLVRLLCCGAEREMTHERINLRKDKKPKSCIACRYEKDESRSPEAKQRMREAQAFARGLEGGEARSVVDMAPPPPSALNLPKGWMPR